MEILADKLRPQKLDDVIIVPKIWFSTVFASCNTVFVSFSK